ncbi:MULTISPECIES: sensor histidine kinase [unclassified Micromonospora]|uniref:sensor histidine kinase n=1 Tax=unclassified Micromonospora TaxID=2617518 RepID=UPI00098D395C|nr:MULTISPECIES: sensor histidine kinase [unclassified Micromonospora]MDI5940385.1 sensor histidine kinase [Micromonospora sp. DH15]
MGDTRTDAGTTGRGLPPAVRAEILDAYEQRLRATGNAIFADPEARRQALCQANAVIDDVDRYGASGTAEMTPVATPFTLSVGRDRAQRGIHPVQSLRAATLLFEAALPPLIREYARGDADDGAVTATIAATLHRTIMARIETGALSYVGFLLERVFTSHLAERRRIGRELHDRVAHAIGVGLQHLDLHRIYQKRRSDRAEGKLDQAGRAMRDALSLTRALSEELRHSVGPAGLEDALRGYLKASVPSSVAITCTVTGDTRTVPQAIAEEIYLVLREAVRNALLHSGSDRLDVSVEVCGTALTATVRDHGRGFTPSPQDLSGGGLLSMRERVELVGGAVSICPGPAGGTTVAICVPLSGESR